MSKNKEEIKDEKVTEEAVKENISEEADEMLDDAAEAAADESANTDAEEAKDTSSENADSEEKFKSKKADPRDAMIEELSDKVKRQMAEFDNFRKRTEKEKSQMFEMGASDIIKKLLPIVDNFDRGFKTIPEEERNSAFAQGMDMVYKQMLKMLEESGVKPIEAVGVEFNPDLHNAVMHVEDDSVGDNTVVEEFEKGYTYRDTVIRHSMVKVAN